MHDRIEKVGRGSLIQHGKHNDRVYLMKLDERDADSIISELSQLAKTNRYSKIFGKVPQNLAPLFFANGFIQEAFISNFYNQQDDVFFVSKFLNPERLRDIEKERLIGLANQLAETNPTNNKTSLRTAGYEVRRLIKADAATISEIYGQVFKTYPFPIDDPAYILKSMDDNVQYFGIEKDGKLVALASAEIDFKGGNAEMTDFATLKKHTGRNLSSLLLRRMEDEMKKQGIKMLYTIARLKSFAMNKTFIRNGYQYSGTLLKNTNISGKIESMNVYYKQI